MNITDIKPGATVRWTTVDAAYTVVEREQDPARRPFVMIKAADPDTQPQLACVPAWDLEPVAEAVDATNR